MAKRKTSKAVGYSSKSKKISEKALNDRVFSIIQSPGRIARKEVNLEFLISKLPEYKKRHITKAIDIQLHVRYPK